MASTIRQVAARELKRAFPWTSTPLIVGAPMRIISDPALALAVSKAGGLGFIGPGAHPSDLASALETTEKLIQDNPDSSSSRFLNLSKESEEESSIQRALPIGIGIQTWTGDLGVTTKILKECKRPPCAVWLFAPRHGQAELDEWASGIRNATATENHEEQSTQIWIQVASVKDALSAAHSAQPPNVLVIQGSDAGGHSLTRSASLTTLLPEVADALSPSTPSSTCENEHNNPTSPFDTPTNPIPLIAAGGLTDARGVLSALALGACGAAMGTRFLATPEASISPGYVRHVLAATDGGQSTIRTQLYNHLRGNFDWPSEYDARGLVNASWRDFESGVDFGELQRRHEEVKEKGREEEEAWGEKRGRVATYAGTGVGLVREVKGAGEIVEEVREGVRRVLESVRARLGDEVVEEEG